MHNLRAQAAVGLDPIVVTELGWPRAVGVSDVDAETIVDGIPHYRLDRGSAYVPAQLPVDRRVQDTTDDLVPLVARLRPAILHAHSGHRGGEHALIALALRQRFGIPVVYEVRGLFEANWSTNQERAAASELYRRRLDRETQILHQVDGILAISEALAEDMVARGVSREKITVLPNGIDPDELQRPPRDPALRSSLGFDGQFVVGYLGNLDHWREGIEVLALAVSMLRTSGRDDIAMLVVGDGSRRDRLEADVEALGLGAACQFTGRVPPTEVAQYYAQMDLFANPRLDERASRLITPLKPYEAMALGVPVLVSDLPALVEIVAPPVRGMTAPAGNARALADAIARLADDPSARTRMTLAAEAWVRSERTWRANGDRYRAVYERLLGPLDR